MGHCWYLPLFVFLLFTLAASGQRVAFLTPDKAEASRNFAEKLEDRLGQKLRVLDDSMSEAAYLSTAPATPFNMTAVLSKEIGLRIGCDFFILIRSATQRRSAFQRAEYYESYSAIYVVSTRTGRLVFWKLQSFEAGKPAKAEKMLDDSVKGLASEVEIQVAAAMKKELAESAPPQMEEPEPDSPPKANFRAPIPFRRIKPEFTTQAAFYDTAATVEISVDLDAVGTIMRTEVVRWAGYGLDESVEKTVRQMNWRPAERNGKALPMRFLLRYNFKKVEKKEITQIHK